MLYISRIVGRGKYGVIDTDDGAESFITSEELYNYVCDIGLDIKGVITEIVMVRKKPKLAIKGIKVYQDPNSATPQQAKINMLGGWDVKTLNNRVVSVSLSNPDVAKSVPLRLSDYGVACGDYIFSSMPFVNGGQFVVILDDNIDFNNKSLKDWQNAGIILNTSEVTTKRGFNIICREVGKLYNIEALMNDMRIIDTELRCDYYRACLLLQRGAMRVQGIGSIRDVAFNYAKANQFITKQYRAEFLSLCSASILFPTGNRWMEECKKFAIWLANPMNSGILEFDDFNSVWNSNFRSVFRVLREGSTCNKSVLCRFENYLLYFTPTEELQHAFMKLCGSTRESLLTFAKKRGWLR